MAGITGEVVVVDPVPAAEQMAAGQQKYAADKGKRFGKWTVIEPFAGKRRNGSRLVLARCESCGAEKVVQLALLKTGQSKQCRKCHEGRRRLATEDKGKRFGGWTVIEQCNGASKDPHLYVLVRCACGAEKDARLDRLKKGVLRQCSECASRQVGRSPEGRARVSPENLARLRERNRSPESRARAAELMTKRNSSPEGRAQLARLHEEWSRSPEGRAHMARAGGEWRRSPEGRAHLDRLHEEWARSPENRAQAAAQMAEFHSIPRTGSAQEPVYACPDCGPGGGKILAFRTKDEESAHFAGYPHGRGKRADTGVLVVECTGSLAHR